MPARFEPGLVPIFIRSDDDIYYDCNKGFIAPTVGLGYFWRGAEDGDGHWVVSHILSGFRLPGEFKTEQQAQSMVNALSDIGVDWWQTQEALKALPEWEGFEKRYEGIVKGVCPEALDSASTTDATAGA